VDKLLSAEEDSNLMKKITGYDDCLVSTLNPGIAADGSNPENASNPKIKPQHACNVPYSEVTDYI